LIGPDSDFTLDGVAEALRAWDWRVQMDREPGEHQPERIDRGHGGEVVAFFGGWRMRVGWDAQAPPSTRAVVVTDPEPDDEEQPRERFSSNEAYWDYLDARPCYEVLHHSCLIALLARFRGVVAFNHWDEDSEVGDESSGRWWTRERVVGKEAEPRAAPDPAT
jgi:hypothetical protein